MTTYKIKMTPKVKALVAGTDGARKRDFNFDVVTRPQQNTASFWDGGSRDYFTVINIRTGTRTTPPTGTYPTFQATYDLKPGEILLQTGISCGKPFSPYIHCLPESEARVRAWLGLPDYDPQPEQPIVPLGFASLNPQTGETEIRTK